MDSVVVPARPDWCQEGDDPVDGKDNEGKEFSKGKVWSDKVQAVMK